MACTKSVSGNQEQATSGAASSNNAGQDIESLFSSHKVLDDVQVLQHASKAAPPWFKKNFPAFKFDDTKSAMVNFKRLSEESKWKSKKGNRRKWTHDFFSTIVLSICPTPEYCHYKQPWANAVNSVLPGFAWKEPESLNTAFDRFVEQRGLKKNDKKYAEYLTKLRRAITTAMKDNVANTLEKSAKQPAQGSAQKSVVLPIREPAKPASKPAPNSAQKPAQRSIKASPKRTSVVQEPLTTATRADAAGGFFANFSDFAYDPSKGLFQEFERLASHRQWGTKKYRKMRAACVIDAFEDEWSEIIYTPDACEDDDTDEDGWFGVSISKTSRLAQWQDLCHEVGVDPVPKTISQCKKALKKVYINIEDLVEARKLQRVNGDGTIRVKQFETAGALAAYIKKTGKIFPKKEAKREGALRLLLIHVFSSPNSNGKASMR